MNDLTREEIMSMQPGRELNDLVKIHVMGWKPERVGVNLIEWFEEKEGIRYNVSYNAKTFNPSQSISSAWEVVGKMRSLGNHIDVFTWEDKWGTEISKGDTVYVREYTLEAPEAICKTALLAVMTL